MKNHYKLGYTDQLNEIPPMDIPVTGKLPSWLSGTLVRNGPGRWDAKTGGKSFNHWFDGMSMLHGFTFGEGKVSYQNRFLRSPAYDKAMKAGTLQTREFATDPCWNIFQKFFQLFFDKASGTNGVININKVADQYLAVTELPKPMEIDPATLETLGEYHYSNPSLGNFLSVHPQYDFPTKEHYNSTLKFGFHPVYNIVKYHENSGQRNLLGTVPASPAGYVHSFGMSENYIILAQNPMVVGHILDLIFANRTILQSFIWEPEQGVRISVLSKETGDIVKSFVIDPFFFFHHINAYEQGNEIIVDLQTYSDMSILNDFYLDKLRSDDPFKTEGNITRLRLPLASGDVKKEILYDDPFDLPRIDYRAVNTKPYRFVYGNGINQDPAYAGDFFNQLVKVDVQSGESWSWFEAGNYPGEPVFVADPNGANEDDGVILSVVLNSQKENSFLLILDAKTLQEIARAEVPQHIPFGFHGSLYHTKGTS